MTHDVKLKDVRKTLLRTDEYVHRVAWYKRQKLGELGDLGYGEIAGVDLTEPEEIPEQALDEDFWRQRTRDLWLDESPETDEEIFDWYGAHTEYLAENMIRQAEVVDDIRQVHYWLRDHAPGTKVLDYGGGVGDFSLYLVEQGYEPVYSDVMGSFPNLVSKRISERSPLNVKVIPIPAVGYTPGDITSGMDAAVCLEVIEHLPDPEAVIDGFASAIDPGGVLITSWTFSDWSDDPDDVYTPCHINTGRDRSREVREYMELYFEEIEHTWNAQMRLWRRL